MIQQAETKGARGVHSPLTDEETDRLATLEAVIDRGFKTFVEVGSALFEIRDRRLYRASHRTFEDFCRERWEIGRHRANQLIEAAVVATNLGATDPRPTAERQVRPLASLPPDKQREAWTVAVEAAPDRKPTGKHVEAAVAKVAPKPAPRPEPEPEVEYDPYEAEERAAIQAADEDPSDIAALRAAGIIPEAAVVEISDPDPVGEDEASGDEADMPDAEWLALCPAREHLSGVLLRNFDCDALAFRVVTPLRLKFARACKRITNQSKKDAKGNIGPWMVRHFRYLRINHPRQWRVCFDCKGTGQVQMIGDCPKCNHQGYLV